MRLRVFTVAFVSVLMLVARVAGVQDPPTLTPEAAAKRVNEKCIVEMTVASTGKGNGVFFLNSKENYRDEGNFAIFISKEGVESFKTAKIDDLVAHFDGKKIRVSGTVILYRERPEIKVEKAEQIQVMDKK